MEHYTENNGHVQLHFVPSFIFRIPPGESLATVQHFVFVLDCVSSLFRSFIPQVGQAHLLISNDPNRDSPICFYGTNHIELNTRPTRWAQIAYQFSHELCHHCINGIVDQNLRWFEESVCETAALFFMQVLGITWKKNNEQLYASSGGLYADELIRYAADTAKNFIAFDLKDPATRKQLEADCYDRKRNRYLANHLLSIFAHHPNTWGAIPLLSTIHQQSLEEALDVWILASPPAALPGLREIRALF